MITKIQTALIFIMILALIQAGFSQIPTTGQRIPVSKQTCWQNSGLLPTVRTGGLTPATPNAADHIIIMDPTGVGWVSNPPNFCLIFKHKI